MRHGYQGFEHGLVGATWSNDLLREDKTCHLELSSGGLRFLCIDLDQKEHGEEKRTGYTKKFEGSRT